MTAVSLRPYQQEAMQAIAEGYRRGVRSMLTVLPTGTGKTVLFLTIVVEWGPSADNRVLILTHRDELIQQPYDELRRIAPDLEVGICKAEQNEIGRPVVIASVQTLSRPKRLEQFLRAGALPTLLITDEAHHAVASTYRRIYDALRAETPDGPLHLGFTATPERFDGVGLHTVFREVAYHRDIKQMVLDAWLTEPCGRIVAVDALDLDHVRPNDSGDYSDAGLDEVMDQHIIDAIAQAWHRYAADRTTVAFTPSVRTAQMLAEAVNRLAGAPVAEEVDGDTPMDRRRDILTRLKAGQLRLVANCEVLTEGFDAPSVDCILVARPTKSEGLYVQMVGRGLRLYPGKKNTLVLDVTGISLEHSLCVLPKLVGLPPEDMEGRTVTEQAEYLDDRRRKLQLAQQDAIVDLLRRRQRWAWIEVEHGRVWALSVGNQRTLLVAGSAPVSQPGAWVAVVLSPIERNILWQGCGEQAMENALGAAETWLAQQRDSLALIASGSDWRHADEPATDRQLSALYRWRVQNIPEGVTKGQATDLLTTAVARAWLREITPILLAAAKTNPESQAIPSASQVVGRSGGPESLLQALPSRG